MVCAVPSSAWGADVTFRQFDEDGPFRKAIFRLDGPVEAGDSKQVSDAVAKMNEAPSNAFRTVFAIELNSDGGSYLEGIELALTLRRLGVGTIVRTGDRCFSSCAIAFLGGSSGLKDPTPVEEADPLPNQLPDRSLEKGAALGFHAPYLVVTNGEYNAEMVQTAYRAAVLGIARLVEVADQLYVTPAELPKLLAPDRDEVFLVDHVDAVRTLGIAYTDYSYQMRDKAGYTRSMIANACINRYYHLQRRSSAPGFGVADAALSEFVEGSQLMENGEDSVAIGYRALKQGTADAAVVYMPIAKTLDGNRFIWCLFTISPSEASTFYKPAGTIEELFGELGKNKDVWDFERAESTIRLGTGDPLADSLKAIDLVPPTTKLTDVAGLLDGYLSREQVIGK